MPEQKWEDHFKEPNLIFAPYEVGLLMAAFNTDQVAMLLRGIAFTEGGIGPQKIPYRECFSYQQVSYCVETRHPLNASTEMGITDQVIISVKEGDELLISVIMTYKAYDNLLQDVIGLFNGVSLRKPSVYLKGILEALDEHKPSEVRDEREKYITVYFDLDSAEDQPFIVAPPKPIVVSTPYQPSELTNSRPDIKTSLFSVKRTKSTSVPDPVYRHESDLAQAFKTQPFDSFFAVFFSLHRGLSWDSVPTPYLGSSPIDKEGRFGFKVRTVGLCYEDARHAAELSIESVAELAGLSEGYIKLIESDRCLISTEHQKKLYDLYLRNSEQISFDNEWKNILKYAQREVVDKKQSSRGTLNNQYNLELAARFVGAATGDAYCDFLSNLRKELGLSKVAMADALGISEGAIRRYETGTAHPPPEVLQKYANLIKRPLVIEYIPEIKR
ncbi:MAG: helix-turn-helix transcriptional regulator [Pseudomonadota bacterium]